MKSLQKIEFLYNKNPLCRGFLFGFNVVCRYFAYRLPTDCSQVLAFQLMQRPCSETTTREDLGHRSSMRVSNFCFSDQWANFSRFRGSSENTCDISSRVFLGQYSGIICTSYKYPERIERICHIIEYFSRDSETFTEIRSRENISSEKIINKFDNRNSHIRWSMDWSFRKFWNIIFYPLEYLFTGGDKKWGTKYTDKRA